MTWVCTMRTTELLYVNHAMAKQPFVLRYNPGYLIILCTYNLTPPPQCDG